MQLNNREINKQFCDTKTWKGHNEWDTMKYTKE